MSSAEGSTAFVVLERGGRLPSRWSRTKAVHRIIVAQGRTESSAQLFARTTARLAEIEARRPRLEHALLSCNESSASPLARTREKLADLLLAHLSRARGARLVLAAKRGAGAELRSELVGLADRALTNIGANGGSVSIWFSDDGAEQ